MATHSVERKAILKWRNKFSGEEGFVKSVSKKNGCFYSTTNIHEAKKYPSVRATQKDLDFLMYIGEFERNYFEGFEIAVRQ